MSMIHGASVKTLYGGLYAYTGARNWNWVGNFKSAYFCPVNYFDRFKSIPQENQKMKSQNFFCIVLGGFDTCFISTFKATFEFNVGERAIRRSNFCANRKLLDLKLPIYRYTSRAAHSRNISKSRPARDGIYVDRHFALRV